jgi:hypothetical protein
MRGERADHQRFELRALQHFERGRQQGGGIDRHQQPGARIRNLIGQFGGGVERAEIDQRRPGDRSAVIGGDIVRHVGQVEPHPVAPRDAEPLEPGREAQRLAVQLGIGVFAAHEIDQRAIAMGGNAGREEIGQRQRRKVHPPVAGMHIVLEPGLAGGRISHPASLAAGAAEEQANALPLRQ